ncbi:uncharacterized protein N0V89_006627 [Didymosphaeria variabile]|uniref:RING-type domain-containing protein n=1 Tax=Didymosphaeria variabile TaxID=1932322 RepID=A0A9W8XJH9_9PLEO|nr:uncharacterized protein N0V89_006627 [Didymosphaeria variabile]KAJ4351288.1 hypothetical protein N0V89_006627 [Didymosphaeria variabile]
MEDTPVLVSPALIKLESMSSSQNTDNMDLSNPSAENTSHEHRNAAQLLTGNSEIAFGETSMSEVSGVEEIRDSPEHGSAMEAPLATAFAPRLRSSPPRAQNIHTDTPPNGISSAAPASSAAEPSQLVDRRIIVAAQDFVDRALGEENARTLPSREQFLNPESANGLLLLSDPRTDVRPQDVCSICLEKIEDLSGAVVIIACGHIYHRHCLYTWFENPARFGTCPMDRRRLFVMPRRDNRRGRLVDGSHLHGPDGLLVLGRRREEIQGRLNPDDALRIAAASLARMHGPREARQFIAEVDRRRRQSNVSRRLVIEPRLRADPDFRRAEQDRSDRLEAVLHARAAELYRGQSNHRIDELGRRVDRHSGTEQTAGVASELLFQDETVRVRLPRPSAYRTSHEPEGP